MSLSAIVVPTKIPCDTELGPKVCCENAFQEKKIANAISEFFNFIVYKFYFYVQYS